MELEKLTQSVTELEEYSELDCMQQVWLISSVKWVEIFCVFNAQRLWKEFRVILSLQTFRHLCSLPFDALS